MLACKARLIETIVLSEADAFIILGRYAQQYAASLILETKVRNNWDDIMFIPHPAYLIRRGGENNTALFNSYYKTIRDFLKKRIVYGKKDIRPEENKVIRRYGKKVITILNRK